MYALNIVYAALSFPRGHVLAACSHEGVERICFASTPAFSTIARVQKYFPGAAVRKADEIEADPTCCRRVIEELQEYFAGTRRSFTVPLRLRGTPFQQQVWELVRRIPYGATRTYGALAASLGTKTLCRAVGLANGANPLPILVPCHRVIGQHGALTGYGGGIALKQYLLRLEGAILL